jgi:lysophospholipase L1-like esterase
MHSPSRWALLAILAWAAGSPVTLIRPAIAAEASPASGPTDMIRIPGAPASDRAHTPPTARDDAQAGFAVGDLWQVRGRVWQAVSVQPGAARWVQMQTGRPGDAFGPHTVFAGGPMQMVSAYTGPALDIGTTVSGRVQQRTIAIGPDGQFDTAALDAALAGRDAGTDAVVTRIYDQSGHGHHLTALPGHAVAHIGAVRIAGHDAVTWGEQNGPGGFRIPDSLQVPRNGFFFGTTGLSASSNAASGAYPVFAMLGQGFGAPTVKVFTGSYTLDGYVHLADANSPDQKSGLVVTNSPSAFGVAAGPDGYVLMSANTTVRHRSVLRPGFLTGGYIGYDADGGDWFSQGRNTGQWTGLVIADATPSDDALRAFRAAAAVAGDFMPQLRTVFVAIGDSRTEGYQLFDGGNWPLLMQGKGRYQSYNFAVSGATTRQMRSALPAVGSAAWGASRRVAVVFGGFNDHLEQNHISADETVDNLAVIVKTLKSYGFTVALVSEANTGGSRREAIAEAVRHGVIPADLNIDPFRIGQPLYSVENRRYWQDDDTHLTAEGAAMLSNTVWSSIGPMLSAPTDGVER